jgi:hypothetical protein
VSFLKSLLILNIRSSEAIQESIVTVCLFLFIPINHLTILSSVAIAGGLYFFFLGFQLLARKRLLLTTPTSKIRSAALGLVEVNGVAAGPYTVSAPITGKPCFLYQTSAWQQHDGKKQEWEKVADETLHLPFFIDDSTGQLLIEPLGADLDLHSDFREEYAASFFSLNLDDVPPRVSVFLSRQGIVPGRRLRIEERLIQPEDALFVAGTLTENPGVQVRPFSPRSDYTHNSAPNNFAEHLPAPQIIRLASGAAPSTTRNEPAGENRGRARSRRHHQTRGVVRRRSPVPNCSRRRKRAAFASLRPRRRSGQAIRLQSHSACRIDERRESSYVRDLLPQPEGIRQCAGLEIRRHGLGRRRHHAARPLRAAGADGVAVTDRGSWHLAGVLRPLLRSLRSQ